MYEYAIKIRYQDDVEAGRQELERRGLFDAATQQILKDVADFRNSVAHRHAIFVTAHSPIESQPVGEYKRYAPYCMYFTSER